MRIVSDFHDYYDAVQATGQDETVVYVRKAVQQTYDLNQYPFPWLRWSNDGWWHWGGRLKGPSITQSIVGFCGRIYPVLVVEMHPCFAIHEVDEQIESRLKPAAIEEYRWKARSRHREWRRRSRQYPSEARREVIEGFLAECKAKAETFRDVFVQNKCPLFVASCRYDGKLRGKITYNGRLADLEFFRLFDPFSAFQEIAMYFGNMAQTKQTNPRGFGQRLGGRKRV